MARRRQDKLTEPPQNRKRKNEAIIRFLFAPTIPDHPADLVAKTLFYHGRGKFRGNNSLLAGATNACKLLIRFAIG
jgi:hypothetical protein